MSDAPRVLFTVLCAWLFGLITSVGILDVTGRTPQDIEHRMRIEAVETGHAEWVVTGPDGSTEFRWLEVESEVGHE